MADQQPLPPTPPLTSEGFAANTWQRWLEILRRRLAEAYSIDNPAPADLSVVTQPQLVAVFFQLKKVAVIQRKNAVLNNLELLGTLLVDGTSHLKDDVLLDKKLTVTDLLSALADATVGRDLGVSRDLSVTRNLAVTGDTQFTGTLRAIGDVHCDGDVQIDGGATINGNLVSGAFACNAASPQTSAALGPAAVTAADAIVLVNLIRAALIANGIGS